MKTVTRRSVFIAVFLGMALILTGCIYCIFFSAGKINFTTTLELVANWRTTPPAAKLKRGFKWEKTPFLRLCGQHGAIMRLAAYKFLYGSSTGEKSMWPWQQNCCRKVVTPVTFSLNGAVGPYSGTGFQEGPAYSRAMW